MAQTVLPAKSVLQPIRRRSFRPIGKRGPAPCLGMWLPRSAGEERVQRLLRSIFPLLMERALVSRRRGGAGRCAADGSGGGVVWSGDQLAHAKRQGTLETELTEATNAALLGLVGKNLDFVGGGRGVCSACVQPFPRCGGWRVGVVMRSRRPRGSAASSLFHRRDGDMRAGRAECGRIDGREVMG